MRVGMMKARKHEEARQIRKAPHNNPASPGTKMGARSFGAEPTEIQALKQSCVYEKMSPRG